MTQPTSAYQLIASHNQDIRVNLYTPAHQGIAQNSLSQEIYEYDVPFLTRPRTNNIEQHFSRLYGTKHSFWLTGGGTQAVLTACALLGTQYKRVAIALNSHISTINGIILAGLEPYFIASKSLMPTTSEVIAALATSSVSTLLLTHPSYEGVTIELAKVADYCRRHDIALVVDEAHGSHFPFLGEQWQSAIALGADIVTHSMHKYTGSLVQTALLHLPSSSRFSVEEVMGVLALFEPTTRNNLLMLSIEDAINKGYSESGQALFRQAIKECASLRVQLDGYGKILTYDPQVSDPLKIYLTSDRTTGEQLAELLYAHGIDGEFYSEEGLLLIFSFHHNQQDFQYIRETFAKVVSILREKEPRNIFPESYFCRQPQIKVLPKEAFFSRKQKLTLEQALGKISGCCIKKVPPGIPVLIPGEEITNWHLKILPSTTIVDIIS
ncbi:aminotransferase class I/II-fold pyridoxal phosphate-dependent enzyme [Aetokthonos hydrillicola Thurmond2011]|uniref:Aminotransferase class I/II-fold pyridoxal phosphate-dependent enzyme n=1 Tax=Aetokthonos hydrillicola Thurmond2011 TaxID=2712845 RepID=A0AAP5ICF2_9CYAN|nr:aminotransferase class I/II-fold pyridoxal phosphate-dependent enzyme [Aetokthonos hydrillicola]MBO3461934.1 aminotransferase class I/II-fold pyridoxal phosphate-dependent enzyme [Aetokthonos hydrillicola CCALA 1050]MBW4585401.1 aminotransferase class I/II-fold pyridoxal phosphate-dependent enzyme [Aetokthonos hydrillicola CCALA 1050]MDR9899092.1 aminotransferase class I/II-fold pyridoxal phosphate-dependent enzyme [Aetokthonos hydrillicola Thurmond2011]